VHTWTLPLVVHCVCPGTQVQHWPCSQPAAPQSVPFCHSVQPLLPFTQVWVRLPAHWAAPKVHALLQVATHWPLLQTWVPVQVDPFDHP
jgi:hypothetical protein